MSNQRYVHKNQSSYRPSNGCRLCGACCISGTEIECRASVCLFRESRQCQSNGLGHGNCGICYVGILPAWGNSNKICSYNGCGKDAVAFGSRGKKFVCAFHATKQNPNILDNCIITRNNGWKLVEESANSPY